MKKILGIIVAIVLVIGAGVYVKSTNTADPGKGGLTPIVIASQDPGGGGL